MGETRGLTKCKIRQARVMLFLGFHGKATTLANDVYCEWMRYNRLGFELDDKVEQRVHELEDAAKKESE